MRLGRPCVLVLALVCTGSWARADAPLAAEPGVPPGNDPALKAPPPQPEPGSVTERARLLVEALRTGEPERADPFFYPREDFPRIKAIGNPDRYFRHLLRLYHEDIAALRKQVRHPESLEFLGFELGRARRWIPRGKEANALPYWAVYRSVLKVKDGERSVDLRVRVMISWQDQWYVTHLSRMK